MPSNQRDRLFGQLAVRQGLIKTEQLQEVEEAIAGQDDVRLSDVLLERKLITADQRDDLNQQLEKCVEEADGDAGRALSSLEAELQSKAAEADADPFGATSDSRSPDTKRLPRSHTGESTAAFEATIITPVVEGDPEAALEAHLAETIDRQKGFDAFGATLDVPPSKQVSLRLDQRERDSSQQSRYTLTQVCGVGGIGEVWLAKDPSLNREVALKKFRADREDDSSNLVRLVKEAQITGQLEHPNIIPVHELDQMDDGSPYYTMKLLRGQTLSQRIQDYHRNRKQDGDGLLALHNLLDIFVDVCNAIAYAGARGIVHRDLKPANIMLGNFGEVLVLDWGLATIVLPAKKQSDDDDLGPVTLDRITDPTETVEGQIVGTPAYMAPEQAGGRISMIDHRTDVYGLGAVLFTMLVGKTPHRGQTTGNTARDTMHLLQGIIDGPTPRPRDLTPSIPAPLDAICAKAMSRDHKERYQNSRDLAQDVKRWMADEPVSVYEEPWTEKARRWLRKHRTLARSVGAAVVLVAAVSTVSTFVVRGALKRETESHAQTESAKEAEAVAKVEARRQFQRARRAVDESLTGISAALLNFPGAQEYRIRLLEQAADDYEKFASEESDDPEMKLEFTRALIRLGDVRKLLNQFDKSKQAYESAVQNLTELNAETPALVELARAHIKLGLLHSAAGQSNEAEQEFQKSLDLMKEAEAGDVSFDADELHRAQAAAHGNLGVLFSGTQRSAEAEDQLASCEALWQALAERTDEPGDHANLAKSRLAQANHFQQTGDVDESLAQVRSAVDEFDKLVELDPDEPSYLQGLADALLTLAGTRYLLGHTEEQIQATEQAIGEYIALIKTRPDVPVYRENLAAAQTDMAQAHYRLGQMAEAEEAAAIGLRIAMELLDQYPTVDRYYVTELYARITLAQILRDSGQVELADQHLQEALSSSSGLVELSFDEPLYHRLQGECRNNVGLVYLLTNDLERARQLFSAAVRDFEKSLELAEDSHLARDGLAWSLAYLGDALTQLDRTDEASDAYRRAIRTRGEAIDKTPNELANEVWMLVTCRDAEQRNPVQAIASAKLAIDRAPANARYHTLLAAAHLRAGDHATCLTTLAKATTLNVSQKSTIGFWKAMAEWQSGDEATARKTFDAAVRQMDAVAPGDIKLRVLLEEAAALLGVAPPAEEQALPGDM